MNAPRGSLSHTWGCRFVGIMSSTLVFFGDNQKHSTRPRFCLLSPHTSSTLAERSMMKLTIVANLLALAAWQIVEVGSIADAQSGLSTNAFTKRSPQGSSGVNANILGRKVPKEPREIELPDYWSIRMSNYREPYLVRGDIERFLWSFITDVSSFVSTSAASSYRMNMIFNAF